MFKGVKIIAAGGYVPEKVVTNDDLAEIVETSDEWISKRTGMKERHFVEEGQGCTDIAEAAAKDAIEKSIRRAGIDPQEIGVLIVATLSADNFSPSTACLLQKRLGLPNSILAFDLNAACSGFVFGLEAMRGCLMSTGAKYGLLVGAEVLSKKMDMTDRGTCVLFGDGAAAAVVELADNLYQTVYGVDGNDEMINCSVPTGTIEMDGQGTYKFAVSTVPTLIEEALAKAGKTPDDITHYILHQANLRIIESVAKKLNQPMEKFVVTLDKYGNTSAASVGLALTDARNDHLLTRGELLLVCAFGAGKTYAATVMEW